MKKLTPLLIALVFLIGCEKQTTIIEIPVADDQRFSGIEADKISIVTDSVTGCKYIYVEDGSGNYKTTAMSPMFNASGVIDCDQ